MKTPCASARLFTGATPSSVIVAPWPRSGLVGMTPVPTIRIRAVVSSPGSSQVPAWPMASYRSPIRRWSVSSVSGPSRISPGSRGGRLEDD